MNREQRNVDIRAKLLEVGVKNLLEFGYHGTGIQQLVQEVGVPKGSFYNYFSSKEDFAVEVINHYSNCFAQQLVQAKAKDTEPIKILNTYFTSIMGNFKSTDYHGGCLIANLAGELDSSAVCRRALAQGFNDWSKDLAQVIHEGQEQGVFRTDMQANELADMLIESWEGGVMRMKVERSLEPLQRLLSTMLHGFFLKTAEIPRSSQ